MNQFWSEVADVLRTSHDVSGSAALDLAAKYRKKIDDQRLDDMVLHFGVDHVAEMIVEGEEALQTANPPPQQEVIQAATRPVEAWLVKRLTRSDVRQPLTHASGIRISREHLQFLTGREVGEYVEAAASIEFTGESKTAPIRTKVKFDTRERTLGFRLWVPPPILKRTAPDDLMLARRTGRDAIRIVFVRENVPEHGRLLTMLQGESTAVLRLDFPL